MKNQALKTLAASLSGIGFEKRESGLFTRNVNSEVSGWLGLNLVTQAKPLKVNPVVGVRHQRLETLVAELRGKPPHPYIPPTLSTPIGYLTPNGTYMTWSLGTSDSSDSLEGQIEEIVQTVSAYGLLFMTQLDTLAAIVEATEQGKKYGVPYELAYRVPAANYLLGRLDAAQASLVAGMERWGRGSHGAAASFARFHDRLKALIAEGPAPQQAL